MMVANYNWMNIQALSDTPEIKQKLLALNKR